MVMGAKLTSLKTPRMLIGDLSKLSPTERNLYELSYCVLTKDDPSIGKVVADLGIKVLDLKSDSGTETEQNHVCEGDTDANREVNVQKVSLTEDAISTLFYILISDKPFYFSQTYSQWRSYRNYEGCFSCCTGEKSTIYIQPVDNFPSFIQDYCIDLEGVGENLSFWDLLRVFAEAYFDGMSVEILPEVILADTNWNITTRVHHKTGNKQYFVRDFFPILHKVTPPDGYCTMGVSWTDLYPTEDLNFVLGEANNLTKSGIFCFGRYEPKTYNPETHRDISEMTGDLMWRMLKVFSHELTHLFAVTHCWYFYCTMNESTSMRQAFDQPLFLCPVCLRKLQHACGFRVVFRYRKLLNVLSPLSKIYPTTQFRYAVQWLQKCVQFLTTERV